MAEYKYGVLSGPWDDINGEAVCLFKSRQDAEKRKRLVYGDYGVIVRVILLRDDPAPPRRSFTDPWTSADEDRLDARE